MSAIAFPHLWIPNRSIKDRLNSLTEWFSDQKIQRGSDGKVRRGTDGKIKRYATGSEPCCCVGGIVPGTSCTNCGAGTTPSQYTAIFDSVVLCTSCIQFSGGFFTRAKISGVFNGTYCLSQVPGVFGDYCEWDLTDLSIGPTLEIYSDSLCATMTSSHRGVIIKLNKTASSTWVVTASIGDATATVHVFKSGGVSGPSDCVTSFSASNTMGACDLAQPDLTNAGIGGNGGTITIVAGC